MLPRRHLLPRLLAGLQAGMLGGLVLLVWLLVLSKLYLDSVWALFNLFALPVMWRIEWTDAFSWWTITGAALHLVSSSLLGALVGWMAPRPDEGQRISVPPLLFGVILSLLVYEFVWRRLLPQLGGILPPAPVFVSHGLFGACLAQFPRFFLRLEEDGDAVAEEAVAPAET